jgi:hypothetical protein
MTTAGPNGIRHADPIKTRASYAQPTEGPNWDGWENWMEAHKKLLGEEVVEAIAQQMTDPLDRRIRALELELAQTRGALDILKGKGVAGTLRVRGTWESGASYCVNDIVAYNGGSWVAKKDSPGQIPGEGWQLVAAQGKRGVAGERGPPGPPGAAPRFNGAKFSHRGLEIESNTGPISVISSVGVDTTDFSIKLHAADGSTLRISLLPLFEAYHSQTR